MKRGALPRLWEFAAVVAALRARALRLEAEATRGRMLWLLTEAFIELLDAGICCFSNYRNSQRIVSRSVLRGKIA